MNIMLHWSGWRMINLILNERDWHNLRCHFQTPTRKDSVSSSLSTSRAPSATSYVSSTALSHTLENGDTSTSHETTKVTRSCLIFTIIFLKQFDSDLILIRWYPTDKKDSRAYNNRKGEQWSSGARPCTYNINTRSKWARIQYFWRRRYI